MKKYMDKNMLFGLIIGAIIFSTISISALTYYNSNQIYYTNEKGIVNNVNEALNDLYASSGNKLELPYYVQGFNSATSVGGNSSTTGKIVSYNKYDLTNVNTLNFSIANGTSSQTYTVIAALIQNKDDSLTNGTYKQISSVSTQNVSIDVSNLKGEYYIAFTCKYNTSGTYNVTISNIVLQ